MRQILLSNFGYQCEFSFHGKLDDSWSEGTRLVFLFGERHRKPPIIWPNVLNACELIRLGVVGCVGVEEYPFTLEGWAEERIEQRRSQLFTEHGDEKGIFAHFSKSPEFCYFGETLQLFRPSLRVRSVEDPKLHEETACVQGRYVVRRENRYSSLVGAYCRANGVAICDLSDSVHQKLQQQASDELDKEFRADEIHSRREVRFVENLIDFWDKTNPENAIILNTGSSHQQPISARLRGMGISYIHISQETSRLRTEIGPLGEKPTVTKGS
jgi:hypothetical protein